LLQNLLTNNKKTILLVGEFEMSTKAIQEKLIHNMQQWMKIENASVVSTSQILEKTDNPVIRTIMEIIQADSQRHYKVQELIKNSLDTSAISMTPDELADVWDLVEKHIAIEKKTVELAHLSLEALKGKKMVVQEYLLHYLLLDEEKHNSLLEQLETIKKGMYPYS